jgi:hypothetical protein
LSLEDSAQSTQGGEQLCSPLRPLDTSPKYDELKSGNDGEMGMSYLEEEERHRNEMQRIETECAIVHGNREFLKEKLWSKAK